MSLPQTVRDPIYLDHAAGTPLRPEVAEVMAEMTAVAFANPSSSHCAGRLAKQILEDSRERILVAAGGRTMAGSRDRLVFTSGATEANRMAILGVASHPTGVIATSSRDHPGLRLAAEGLARRGWLAAEVPLAPTGGLDTAAIPELVASSPGRRLLTVTTVCGQTGLWEDEPAIARLAATHPEIRIHADATQAAGWRPIGFSTSPFATLALAAHKFGGPRGIGGLIIRDRTEIDPLIPGAQELGLRGGTESVALAVGFARAFELALAEQASESARVANLRADFEAGVRAAATAAGLQAHVVGSMGSRAPHISAVGIAGVDRQMLVISADLAGVCLATGTACSSGSGEPPAILAALGIDEAVRTGVVRASFGRTTAAQDVAIALQRLAPVFDRLRR